MRLRHKISYSLNLVLIIIVALSAYLFILRGNVVESDDERTAIGVSRGERAFLMQEMRKFLEQVHGIVGDLAKGDMAGAARTATAAGMAAAGDAPAALVAKLPVDFKALGFSTHGKFDDLAAALTAGADRQAALAALEDLLTNCTTCHASYRFVVQDGAAK